MKKKKKKEKQANHLVEIMVQADDPNQNFEVDQQNQSFKVMVPSLYIYLYFFLYIEMILN